MIMSVRPEPESTLISHKPITLPRWILQAKYTFLMVIGVVTAIRGSVSLDLTQPTSYTPFWSGAVVLLSAVSLFFSLGTRFDYIEKWTAAAIAGFIFVIAIGSFNTASGSGWLYPTGIMMLPAGRSIGLFIYGSRHVS